MAWLHHSQVGVSSRAVYFVTGDLFPDLLIKEPVNGRVCSKCEIKKPNEEFSYCGGANYFRPECKQCNRELANIRKQLKAEHGNPPEDYQCPVCGLKTDQVEGKGGSAGAWVLDHCHDTGTFRGWLCQKCNRGLGCFGDSIEGLKLGIAYLTKVNEENKKRKLVE